MAKRDITNAEDVSILSNGVKIEGKLTSDGNVRVDGSIIGDVTVNGNLTLGETALLKGNIKANNVSVSGRVEGIVVASDKLILESKSTLIGDLISKILVIEEGAKFEGKSSMGLGSKPHRTEEKNNASE